MVREAKEGDIVVVDGTEFKFGPGSVQFFNSLLSKDVRATEDAMVDIKRRSDAENVTIPFPKLRKAWEDSQRET